MNFLGHAFLSNKDEGLLLGNMMGDFIKGRLALAAYPKQVQAGILMHRAIDQFTDQHPALIRAQLIFKERYQRYSGAIIDTIMDHFLANDAKFFPNEETLQSFSSDTYASLAKQAEHFAPQFDKAFESMQQHNWLFHYKTTMGIKKSLEGLSRRATYLGDTQEAYDLFIAHYFYLNNCYYEFIEDMCIFAHQYRSNLLHETTSN